MRIQVFVAVSALWCAAPSAEAQTTGTGSYVPPGNYQGTTVPPNSTLLGLYDDDQPNTFEGDNAWLGRTIDFTSIHSGQASEDDFVNSVDYVLYSSQYTASNAAGVADSRLVSVPLIWTGASLQLAASGSYNGDYTTVAQKILNDIPPGPAPGQSIIYIRTGWEENLEGEMPWASHGAENYYIAAFQQFVSAFRAVDTSNRFRFVWCPNVGGDPIAISYPGNAYVDVIAMDFYYGLATYTKNPDPDSAFQQMLHPSVNDGLANLASMASSNGKQLAFGEWGVDQDNFGNYVKDFFDWCRTNNCLYATYWNNNGGYSSKLSDGTYPETGAMFRHLFDPANYPVEPIAAPVGVAALAGTGSNTITGNSVNSSTPVTTYYLYKGSTSGGESTTPVATSSSPSFVDQQPNGKAAYYRMGAGNSLSLGYLSSEVTATPRLPGSSAPSDYLNTSSYGYAYSTNKTLEQSIQGAGLTSATIVALISPSSGSGLIAGFPNALAFGISANGYLNIYVEDYFTTKYFSSSSNPVPFPANGQPEWVRVDVDGQNATNTFYVAPVNGSTMPALTSSNWSQLGAPQYSGDYNGIFDSSSEAFNVAGNPDGTNQFFGSVYDVTYYANGKIVARPKFDNQTSGTTSFTDGFNRLWTLGNNATLQ